jgi:hypothetical protein
MHLMLLVLALVLGLVWGLQQLGAMVMLALGKRGLELMHLLVMVVWLLLLHLLAGTALG